MLSSENEDRVGAESKGGWRKLVAALSIVAVFVIATVALVTSSNPSEVESPNIEELNNQNELSFEGTDEYYTDDYYEITEEDTDDDYEVEETLSNSLATFKGVKGEANNEDVVVQKHKGKKKKGKKKKKKKDKKKKDKDDMDDPDEVPPIDEAGVRHLFVRWNDALQTGDSDIVAQRYASNAVLLPTVSDRVRTDYEGIKDYFDTFLAKEPFGEIVEGYIMIGSDWARDGGIYEFTMATDGSVVRARYSYLYVWEDGDWMISQHHSSMMPEPTIPEPITETGVRQLFDRWNDALQTGDPETVANLYSKNAVLLPTLSNIPRDNHELIADYFVGFLAKGPVGDILEGWIMIGDNWCEDVGSYAFTFEDNSVALARYSFVYIFEDGEWKIAHHHSSLEPE